MATIILSIKVIVIETKPYQLEKIQLMIAINIVF